ncbi:hypothetical protein GMSM_45820 [Geomonas sp. Red276]
MRFTCTTCGREHDGIPSYGSDRPTPYWDVPDDKLDKDVFLTQDSCVIADRFFFVRGCIELPVVGTGEFFEWGVWVSLKEENFFIWQDCYESVQRSNIGPFFGWLCSRLPGYPETLYMKTMVHLRDNGIRPLIVPDKTDHPLSIEQRNGITMERVQEIINLMEHSKSQKTEPAI